jgi:threonine/homoserine/homoserine lactone efflux protein
MPTSAEHREVGLDRHASFDISVHIVDIIFVALSSMYITLIALSIRPLSRLVKHLSWIARWQGKIIGSLFITLGMKVAMQHR